MFPENAGRLGLMILSMAVLADWSSRLVAALIQKNRGT
jgi:hypothetical protein